MTRDKRILYISSIAILVLLLSLLFVKTDNSAVWLACLLLPCAVLLPLIIRKRSSLAIQKNEVLLITTIVGVIYTVLIQMTGAWFGYYENPYFITWDTFFTCILPLAVIFVSVEIIRVVLLAQKNKLVDVIAFLICIITDVLAFSTLVHITSLNKFMDLVGMTLFPAISANVYYHHVSKKYGAMPSIALRLIMALPTYFISMMPAVPDVLLAGAKLLLPVVLLAIVGTLYSKQKKNAVRTGEKVSVFGTLLAVVFCAAVAMLISCQFKYGMLVIATESMTGEINKGDAVIYERYEGQAIKEGQVIVFQQNDTNIVHRVVKIEKVGGEVRYYTKGDANTEVDGGYRKKSDIVGLTDIKIAYAGYPTLWLHELINSAN